MHLQTEPHYKLQIHYKTKLAISHFLSNRIYKLGVYNMCDCRHNVYCLGLQSFNNQTIFGYFIHIQDHPLGYITWPRSVWVN